MSLSKLTAEGMVESVSDCFKKVPDIRNQNRISYTLQDVLLAGTAMYMFKSPSLLSFCEKLKANDNAICNLKKLFGIEKIPSDTSFREIVDQVDTKDLRGAFTNIFSNIQRTKSLEKFKYIDGHVLLSTDGTGVFNSDKVHCDHCGIKNHRDGRTEYYHQMYTAAMVNPEFKVVIPFAPEAILKQDGAKKNDCERNASKRFFENFRREHPHLNVIVLEDSLSSNAPHIRMLKDLNLRFILGVKPGDHEYLFEEIEMLESLGGITQHEVLDGKIIHKFKYACGVSINELNENLKVNFIEYEEHNGKKVSKFSWVTDMSVSNETLMKLMKAGRCRWKIENEVHNTLKNQGYEFEHNFGHGYKNLSTNLSYLMMLAFFMDQVQQLLSIPFQRAKIKARTLKDLWSKMRCFLEEILIPNWTSLFLIISGDLKLQIVFPKTMTG